MLSSLTLQAHLCWRTENGSRKQLKLRAHRLHPTSLPAIRGLNRAFQRSATNYRPVSPRAAPKNTQSEEDAEDPFAALMQAVRENARWSIASSCRFMEIVVASPPRVLLSSFPQQTTLLLAHTRQARDAGARVEPEREDEVSASKRSDDLRAASRTALLSFLRLESRRAQGPLSLSRSLVCGTTTILRLSPTVMTPGVRCWPLAASAVARAAVTRSTGRDAGKSLLSQNRAYHRTGGLRSRERAAQRGPRDPAGDSREPISIRCGGGLQVPPLLAQPVDLAATGERCSSRRASAPAGTWPPRSSPPCARRAIRLW